jgi:hypothetical protein
VWCDDATTTVIVFGYCAVLGPWLQLGYGKVGTGLESRESGSSVETGSRDRDFSRDQKTVGRGSRDFSRD